MAVLVDQTTFPRCCRYHRAPVERASGPETAMLLLPVLARTPPTTRSSDTLSTSTADHRSAPARPISISPSPDLIAAPRGRDQRDCPVNLMAPLLSSPCRPEIPAPAGFCGVRTVSEAVSCPTLPSTPWLLICL